MEGELNQPPWESKARRKERWCPQKDKEESEEHNLEWQTRRQGDAETEMEHTFGEGRKQARKRNMREKSKE